MFRRDVPEPVTPSAPSSRAMRLTRRLFLGGAGAAIALPVFQSLYRRSAGADTPTPVRRMLCYLVPCGIQMDAWTPSATGRDYSLSPSLQPLAALKDDVLVLTGLNNLPAGADYHGTNDGPGDHARGTGTFLTCSRLNKTAGTDIHNGISVDQVAANAIGMATRFPSLQLGTDGGGTAGDCDSGYSCAYARNVSWASATNPLPKLTNPAVVFDRLFAGMDPNATRMEQARRQAYQTSVLDYALRDAQRLRARLGTTDQRKLDEYLASVREVEQRIASAMSARVCDPGARPPDSVAYVEQLRIMHDLMSLAFECDVTRVITFMNGNAGDNRDFDFIGATGGHHELSHHMDDPEKRRKLRIIDNWEVGQLAYLLNKLKTAREADGTSVLDNTTVFFSSEIEDGNSHAHTNLPVLLAGKCGGAIDTGRHVRFASPQPTANLFMGMLAAMGVRVTSFGDEGTGILPQLGTVSG